MVLEEIRVLQVHLVLKVLPVLLLEYLGQQAQQVFEVQQAPPVQRAQLAPPVLAHLDLLAQQVLRVLRVLAAQQVLRVHRVRRAQVEVMAQQVQLVLLDP